MGSLNVYVFVYLCMTVDVACHYIIGHSMPSSVPLAVGKMTFLFHRQTKLGPDSKFGSLEGSVI